MVTTHYQPISFSVLQCQSCNPNPNCPWTCHFPVKQKKESAPSGKIIVLGFLKAGVECIACLTITNVQNCVLITSLL